MASFLAENWVVISFYALVILGLIAYRKKFEWQGKIIGLLRTNWGIDWMQRMGEKHGKLIRGLGYVGIGVGFLGMLTIVGFLIFGIYQLFTAPAAPPVISPVLPGVQFPGSPFAFPLFETLIALFFVIVVHEASHGLVAAAHGMKVKSSGLLVFGPIFGAFVEPEEEKLTKKPHRVQHSLFAAGPFSNVLLAILMLLLWGGMTVAISSAVTPLGMTFTHTVEGSPADALGLPAGERYVWLDGEAIDDANDLFVAMQNRTPGETIVLGSEEQNYSVTLAAQPDNPEEPWIGIEGVDTAYDVQQTSPWLFAILMFIRSILWWTYVLSLGLGLANLLPLGPVDGGRMWQLVCHKWFGEELGDAVWSKTSMITLLIVVILLIVPIVRDLFFSAAVA